MKRKIEDYINQKVAIECETKEQWQKIIDFSKIELINKFDLSSNKCINLNTIAGGYWGRSSKEDIIKQGYTVYPASDFLEEESKFEKGKWYKNKKLKSLYRNISRNEVIWSKGRFGENYSVEENFENWELLTDLSEIQQFLPDGHPDKIKTEVIPEYVEAISKFDCYIIPGYVYKVTDKTNIKCLQLECNIHTGKYSSGTKLFVDTHEFSFKESTKEAYEAQNKSKQLTGYNLLPNEIYVTDDPTNYIFKTSETSKGYSHYICKFKCFYSILNKDYIWRGNLRLATKEEEKWLNTCISQDKFIPKEDLHLYDDSGLLVKMNEKVKSLLEEAKERYPIGTKFKSVVTRNLFTVESHVNEAKNSNIAFHTIESNSSGNHWGCVYENGTWAEIISLPNEQVQKEKSLVEQVRKGLKLKDRWLKCIKKCDWENITIGEYVQILGNHSICPWVKKKDSKEQNFLDLGRIDREEFELMPEDFSPNEEKEWIPLTSDCIMYNGENISKGFEVSSYYEFDGKSFNQDIYIPSITKKSKKLQTITIESTTDLNLGLTKIKSKQIQTIKI